MAPPPTRNKDIAERLGIHPVTLSHLRGGSRRPSRKLMLTIEDELGWGIAAQMRAFQAENYDTEFRAFLQRRFGIPDRLDDPATTED